MLITTIALAAGDGTALATYGRALSKLEAGQEPKYGWIRMPGSGDQTRPLGAPTVPRSSMDTVLTERGMEISLEFISNDRVLTGTGQEMSVTRPAPPECPCQSLQRQDAQ